MVAGSDNITGWAAEVAIDRYFLEPYGIIPDTPQYKGDLQALLGSEPATQVNISEDGSTVAVMTRSGVWIYSTSDFESQPRFLYMQGGFSENIDLSSDGTLVTVSTSNQLGETVVGSVWIWNTREGIVQTKLNFPMENTGDVAFSPDDRILAITNGDLLLWDMVDSYELLKVEGISGNIEFIPDSPILLAYTQFMGHLVNLNSGAQSEPMFNIQPSLDTPSEPEFFPPAIHPNGQTLIGVYGYDIIFWNAVTGVRQTAISKTTPWNDSEKLCGVAFSPDGQWIVSGGDKVRLWDATFNSVTALRGEYPSDLWGCSIAFNDSGTRFSFSNNSETELWDFSTMTPIAVLDGKDAQFIADEYLVTNTGTHVLIWDTDGEQVAVLND